MYNIKRSGTTIATVRPSSGTMTKKVMGENIVDMSFILTAPITFEVGDYVTVYGEDFTLNALPHFIKHNSKKYEYVCQFQGSQYDLAKYAFLMLGDDNSIKEPDFSIMGNAEAFIDLIIQNANRVGSGWTKGDIDSTETKNISFSNINCLAALSTLADEFKTEFWVIGKTIHFTTKGTASGLTFEYGKGKGLYDIRRSNKDGSSIITRLYAFGSTRNIPSNYRSYSNRLKIPAATGTYLESGVAEYGVIEGVVTFDDIYPKRIGTVSAVDGADVFKFTDSGMDFDVNAQLLPDAAAKVQFLTGLLAGYEFTVKSYNAGTKTFTLNKNDNEKSLEIPGPVFKPSVGDIYVIYDIIMPETYISSAEAELETAGLAYLASNALSRVLYAVNCDPLYFKNEAITVSLGNTVIINDTPLGINETIRIIGLSRSIILDGIEQYRYTLDLSESVQPAKIVRDMIKDEKVQNIIRINDLSNPAKARANWRSSQEMLQMVFDPDGDYYTDKIKPASIETLHIQAGARSQQMQTTILCTAGPGGDDSRFISTAGILHHLTIDPSAVKSWNIAASDYTSLGNGAYYIYAKCEKAGTNGTVLLTASQILVDQDVNYYHFLLGVLHAL